MSEFSQRPFAVGSFTGIRSFRVTPEGVLTGVVRREAWLPGVNEAKCAGSSVQTFARAMQTVAISASDAAWVFTQMGAAMSGRVNLMKRPKPNPVPIPPPARPTHQAGTLDCTCGFYAYYDEGHNPHHGPGNILGIVEGFGVCTAGSRGFRASKARIKALVIPDEAYVPKDSIAALNYGQFLRSSGVQIRERYPDVPVFSTAAAALADFPLTPVEVPRSDPALRYGRHYITYTVAPDVSGWNREMNRILNAYWPKLKREGAGETAQERALRLRRTRNTGPDNPTGLDGFRRRH